jgi:NADH-quinone oxidoreductase subunit A
MAMEIREYLPVLMLFVVAAGFTAFMLIGSEIIGRLANRNRPRPPAKDMPYECGMIPTPLKSTRFPVKFYLVAMLFILFDIEVVFLYPWAVVYKDMVKNPATHNLIFISMLVFLGILLIGYFYAVKKKAFDWRSQS